MAQLSDERLKLLKTYYPSISVDKSYVCYTCHQTKQKKLPFSFGNYHVVHIFLFNTYGYMGSCPIISMNGLRYFLITIIRVTLCKLYKFFYSSFVLITYAKKINPISIHYIL